MSSSNCDGCFRIIDTKHHCISIPNVFDFEMDMCVNLCLGCSSLFDWFVYQYAELYEEQAKKLADKKFRLSKKTLRGMK